MAWTYFLESVESASLLESGLDQLPTAKSIPIVEEYSSLICLDFKSQPPRYGMMLQRLREDSIKESLILSMGDFRARISALQEMEKAWKESEADCFQRSSGCVARLSLDLSSWKTFQPLLLEGEQEWLGKLPPWGMTVGGVLYQQRPLVQDTSGKDGFSWPTPKASDYKRGDSPAERRRDSPCLPAMVRMMATPRTSQASKLIKVPSPSCQNGTHGESLADSIGRLNPESIGKKLSIQFVEVLMGYQIKWTECAPWVIPWYLSKSKKRLKS